MVYFDLLYFCIIFAYTIYFVKVLNEGMAYYTIYCVILGKILDIDSIFRDIRKRERRRPKNSQKFFVDSHVIPCQLPNHRMTREQHSGRLTTPRNKQEQVSYRLPLHSMQEIRRAGEQTSPQVARAAGHPPKRDEGGG